MRYLSVAEMAKKWDVSERSVRNYCAHGRVPEAFLTGKTWNIPENAEKPERTNKKKEKPTTFAFNLCVKRNDNQPTPSTWISSTNLWKMIGIKNSKMTWCETKWIFIFFFTINLVGRA